MCCVFKTWQNLVQHLKSFKQINSKLECLLALNFRPGICSMVSTVTRLQANQVHSYKVALGFIEAVDMSKWKLEQLSRLPALDKTVFCSVANLGFRNYKGMKCTLCWFYLIFLNCPMTVKWIYFHGTFKTKGGGGGGGGGSGGKGEGGSSKPLEPPLDAHCCFKCRIHTCFHPCDWHSVNQSPGVLSSLPGSFNQSNEILSCGSVFIWP